MMALFPGICHKYLKIKKSSFAFWFISLLISTFPSFALADEVAINAFFDEGVLNIDWGPPPTPNGYWRVLIVHHLGGNHNVLASCGPGRGGPCGGTIDSQGHFERDYTSAFLAASLLEDYILTVTVEALDSGQSPLNITGSFGAGIPTPPVLMETGSGSGQNGRISTTLPEPGTVKLTRFGNPLTLSSNSLNANVVWSFASVPAGATGYGFKDKTGSNSEVSITFILGSKTGNYSINASCAMCNNVEGSTETFSVSAAPITLTLSANPTSVYPARTSGNNVAVITATVSDQFGPFPEYAVAFEQPTFDPYFQTGHSHQNTLPDPLKGSYSSFSCVTTADGSCNIAFIASEVSGQAEIVAKSSLGPTQSNSLNIVVWVPELIQFFVRPFPVDEDHWYLPPPSNSQHTGTRAIRGSERDRIFAVGSYYLQNGGSGVLVMGDASLPRGGLFDVNGNWSTPYPDHREGLEIDIGLKTCGTDNSAACSGAPHFDVDEDNLNDALDSWIWGSYVPGEEIGEGPGFHVRFRP